MEYLQYLKSSSTKLWPFRVSLRIFAEKAKPPNPPVLRPGHISMDHVVPGLRTPSAGPRV